MSFVHIVNVEYVKESSLISSKSYALLGFVELVFLIFSKFLYPLTPCSRPNSPIE